jgi:uncharacterized membrane protein YqgA involved in biofilm formation
MDMTGTIINVAAIIVGSLIGILFGARLPEKLKSTIVAGMGIFVVALGLQMFLKTENSLIVLGAVLLGTLLGEWWRIEDGLHKLGEFLESKFSREEEDGSNKFIRGFMTASLLFCIGPVAILGSIQDGLTGNYNLLVVKSILDGFASIAFASTLGIGVAFSSLIILVYQGAISLLATRLDAVITTSMMNELTATGGILLIGVGISSLLEIKKIRVGNMLPALLAAPLIVWVVSLF